MSYFTLPHHIPAVPFNLLHLVSTINDSSDGPVYICIEYKDSRMDEKENLDESKISGDCIFAYTAYLY